MQFWPVIKYSTNNMYIILQEPGDAKQICKFNKSKKVKFPIFEKTVVNGIRASPLWKYLKSEKGLLLKKS